MLYAVNLPFGTIASILRHNHEDFGLVRFHMAEDGSIPTLEWWKNTFIRTEA